ncbi:MAG: type VI secretion system lipoprotein TssJ [Chromatiales bacterium]|jgi:type VI secretion system protein VasD
MYRILQHSIAIIALLITASALNGCATADVLGSKALEYVFAPDPTVVQASIRVADDVNPDSRGRPSPVKTRFYLLETVSVFNSADFYQLKEQGRELLDKDLKLFDKKVFKPGDREDMEFSLPPEEIEVDKLYFAVMVGYWDLDHSEWRAVLEIEAGETTEVVVDIARSDVSIKQID